MNFLTFLVKAIVEAQVLAVKQKDCSQWAGSLWTIDSDKTPNKLLIVSLVRSIGITVYQTPRDSRFFLHNLLMLQLQNTLLQKLP